MEEVKIRGIVTTLLLLFFVLTASSGFVLMLAPHGPVGRFYTFLGINKHTWESVHVISGLLMSILVIFHLYLNRKLYKNELGILFK